VKSADTVMVTIPNQLGVDFNLRLLESIVAIAIAIAVAALLLGQLVRVEPEACAPAPPSVGSPEPGPDPLEPSPRFPWGPPLP
jgi:hypothetical protein